ncbi:MAG: hypothetical protein H7238_06165 [Polaromonas sp.]|nr:hypothetical protein [Polaromonas sp.]
MSIEVRRIFFAALALALVSATLLVTWRFDDATFASAQYTAGRIAGAKFIGFGEGGHTWAGHDDEVLAAIVALLLPSAQFAAQHD